MQQPSRSLFVRFTDYAKEMAKYMRSLGFDKAAKYWEAESK